MGRNNKKSAPKTSPKHKDVFNLIILISKFEKRVFPLIYFVSLSLLVSFLFLLLYPTCVDPDNNEKDNFKCIFILFSSI